MRDAAWRIENLDLCGWVSEDWRAGAAICVVYGGGGGVSYTMHGEEEGDNEK